MWTVLLGSSLALAGDFRFAVAEFTNGSDDPALSPLAHGLQAMVTTDLAAASAVDVVERERLRAVLDEQKLGESGLVAPETAASVGRLLGATHVVTGAFTVVDERMRLDVNLVDVETSSVVLATQVTGEKEAFFELEKDLVKQVIGAVQLELSARERGEMGRLHTADFEAFSLYSEGLSLVDDEQYSTALQKLREAAARDTSFSLARLTLDKYEKLIAELESRADAIEQARIEVETLASEGALADELQVRAWLLERAESQDPRNRVTAFLLLTVGHDRFDYRGPFLPELHGREDRFQMASAADLYARAYFENARPFWPEIPVLPFDIPRLQFPAASSFEADFEAVEARIFDPNPPASRLRDTIQQIRRSAGPRLGMDLATEALLIRDLVLEVEEPWSRAIEGAARRLRSALLLDESTRLFERLSDETADEDELRDIAEEIALNRDMRGILEESPPGSLAPEALRQYWATGTSSRPLPGDRQIYLGEITDEGARQIRARRKVSSRIPVLIDDTLVRFGGEHFETDPRTVDVRRAHTLRYYRHENPQARLQPALFGYDRSNERVLGLTVDYRVPDRWIPGHVYPAHDDWDGDLQLVDHRPTAHVLIGTRWVEPHELDDGPPYRDHAMTALSLRIRPTDITLVRLVERPDERRRGFFEVEALSAEKKIPAADHRKLTVRIRPDGVVIHGAGKPIRFAVEVPEGYLGLDAVGLGLVSLTPTF